MYISPGSIVCQLQTAAPGRIVLLIEGMAGRVFNNKLERRAMGSYVGNRTRSITFFPPVDQGKVDGEREKKK